MDPQAPKKTVPVWRPPAAAGRGQETARADATPASAHAAPSPANVSQVLAAGEAQGLGLAVTQHSTESPPEPHQRPGPLSPGDIIGGRYVVRELVGQGGFAAVYRAADSEIPTHEVAVKLLNDPPPGEQPQATALRELTLIASVSHPSVVQFKDYGWHEGRLFFAMPWYRGRTLGEDVPLDRASARRVFERCAYGLHAMHEAGICHYDIKPDNIFLADIAGFDAGFPVLLDLGIAAKRGERPTALTPEYAPPEIATAMLTGGDAPVGPPADVYSLALSLRNVLEPDTAPPLGESLPAFLNQRATVAVPPPSGKQFRYLASHFQRWLSIDPALRPTAAEFALELAVLTAPEEKRAERRRLFLRAAPVVVLSAIAVGVLWYKLTSTSEELVRQKQVAALEEVETNKRFEQMKQDSKNQLDEKLQLAQQFQAQRDQFREQRDKTRSELSATVEDRNRVRGDLRARTRERDDARAGLLAQTQALEQTRAELAQRSREVAARGEDLAQARADIEAKNREIAQRGRELAEVQADLGRLSRDLQAQTRALADARAEIDARIKDVQRRTKERDDALQNLERRTKERDAAREDLAMRTKELDIRTRQLEQARAALEKAVRRKPAAPAPAPAPGQTAPVETAPAWD